MDDLIVKTWEDLDDESVQSRLEHVAALMAEADELQRNLDKLAADVKDVRDAMKVRTQEARHIGVEAHTRKAERHVDCWRVLVPSRSEAVTMRQDNDEVVAVAPMTEYDLDRIAQTDLAPDAEEVRLIDLYLASKQ